MQRQGNFSQTLAGANNSFSIYDPATTRPDPANPANRIRDPFPGAIIPGNRINPAGLAVVGFYPRANDPGAAFTQANNFFGQASAPLDKDIYGIRLDQYLSPVRRLYGRYTYDKTFRGNPNYYDNVAEINTSDLYFFRHSAVLSYTDSIRPDMLFEGRAGVNRYAPDRIVRSFGFDLSKINMPANLNAQVPVPTFPRFNITTSPRSEAIRATTWCKATTPGRRRVPLPGSRAATPSRWEPNTGCTSSIIRRTPRS